LSQNNQQGNAKADNKVPGRKKTNGVQEPSKQGTGFIQDKTDNNSGREPLMTTHRSEERRSGKAAVKRGIAGAGDDGWAQECTCSGDR
jgi:hypothetical protein